jgi:hypothetical protein
MIFINGICSLSGLKSKNASTSTQQSISLPVKDEKKVHSLSLLQHSKKKNFFFIFTFALILLPKQLLITIFNRVRKGQAVL